MAIAEVSVIGAGLMGAALVERLLECGYRVFVYNRTPGKIEKLLGGGAIPIAVIDEGFMSRGGMLILCLRDETSIMDVFSPVVRKMKGRRECRGMIINTSTVGVEASRRLDAFFKNSNIEYLELPVSGGVEGAQSGQLVGYIGKEPSLLRHEFCGLINNMLSDFCYMPSNEMAQAMKVINNYCESIHLLVAAEALVLAECCGIEKEVIGASLALGRGRSVYLELLLERYKSNVRDVSVPMSIRIKDLALAGELFSRLKVPSSFYSTAYEHYSTIESSSPHTVDQMESYQFLLNAVRAM